jgi:iron complex outermembrane recepter protein
MKGRAGYKYALVAGVSLVACASCSTAHAQDAVPSASQQILDSNNSTIGEVVVTARRRDERALDVPVAVSVLSGSDLQANSVQTVLDIARNVPAFQMQPTAQSKNSVAYTIRSQRQSEQVLTQDLSVAVYFADVTLARSQGANGALFDLSSVQVLKGPQGTLFGRNTTGGAVLLTPQQPTMEYEGYVTGRLGNYDQRFVEGVVNLPIHERLQVRLGGQISRRDGYVTNLFNGRKLEDEDTYSWRAYIRAEPTDNLTNSLVINSYHVDNEHGAGPVLLAATPPATTFFPGITASIAKTQADGWYTANSNNASLAKLQSTLISNTTELSLGEVTLKNIFGYRYLSSALLQDIDGSPFTVFPAYDYAHDHQYSEEFQILGKALDNRLDYIVGAYYFFEQGSNTNGNAPLGAERMSTGDIRNISKSLFAQLDYKVRPDLSVTAGVRQTWDKREITWHNFSGPYGGPYVCALTTNAGARLDPCSRYSSVDFSKPTYTVSLDWHPTTDILLYAAHRRGYRAGGYNLRSNTPAQSVPFLPENVKDFEVGAKTIWRHGDIRGTFNIAAYHQDYRNIQRQQSLILNGLFAGSIIANAASAKIDGVEVDGSVSPLPGLELSAFFSYSDPRYKKWLETQSNGSVVDIRNAPFAGAPKYSGGASVQYKFDAEHSGNFVFNANVYAQSKTYGQDSAIFRTTLQRQTLAIVKGWSIANTRVEWNDMMGSRVSSALYVRNVFDRRYNLSVLDLIDNQLGLLSAWRAEPRMYGAEVKVRF